MIKDAWEGDCVEGRGGGTPTREWGHAGHHLGVSHRWGEGPPTLEAGSHLQYRRQQALQESLAEPHPELPELESVGFGDWAGEGVEEDLAYPRAGTPLRWEEGRGWVEGEE